MSRTIEWCLLVVLVLAGGYTAAEWSLRAPVHPAAVVRPAELVEVVPVAVPQPVAVVPAPVEERSLAALRVGQ